MNKYHKTEKGKKALKKLKTNTTIQTSKGDAGKSANICEESERKDPSYCKWK